MLHLFKKGMVKPFVLCILFVFFLSSQPSNVFADNVFIKGKTKEGVVFVKKPITKNGEDSFVQLRKDGKSYIFKFSKKEKDMIVPNPFGNGKLMVVLITSKNNKNKVYSYTSVEMNAREDIRAIQKTVLSPGKSAYGVKPILDKHFKGWKGWSKEKRVNKVHSYVTHTFSYDFNKWNKVKSKGDWYRPDYNEFMKKRKGICYDISSLTSSLLREMDVPTRLVMGYPKNDKTLYHSWNQVYVNKQWKTVDATFDLHKKTQTPYKKNSSYMVRYIF